MLKRKFLFSWSRRRGLQRGIRGAAVVAGEVRFQVGERLADLGDHEGVIFADGPAGGGRAEIFIEAFAAPGCFDEEDRVFKVIAECMAELQLWAEVMAATVNGETDAERPGQERGVLALVANPDIVTDCPAALGILKVPDERSFCGIFEESGERSLPVVVILALQIDDGLALHVGLAGENEDLERAAGIGGEEVGR